MPQHFFASGDSTSPHLNRRTRLLIPSLSKLVQVASRASQTSTKLESAFLTKLPLEVRQLICAYALGEANFHIIQGSKQLTSSQCRDLRCENHSCFLFPPPLQWTDGRSPLALLQTCRQLWVNRYVFPVSETDTCLQKISSTKWYFQQVLGVSQPSLLGQCLLIRLSTHLQLIHLFHPPPEPQCHTPARYFLRRSLRISPSPQSLRTRYCCLEAIL